MIKKAFEIARESGLAALGSRAIRLAYLRGVRRCLPLIGPVCYAGILAPYDRKLGDLSVPSRWRPDHVEDIPDYEAALVAGLKKYVRSGDRVVVVGGGLGVTATIAALQVGPSGAVECFEGSREGVEKIKITALRNAVTDRLTVHHAVVARSIFVYGTEPERAVVAPAELPECDVLELDCEGAEVETLREMTIRPRVVLVETHGLFGASTVLVSSLLKERSYHVSECGVAEPRLRSHCEKHDIRVVVGLLVSQIARR